MAAGSNWTVSHRVSSKKTLARRAMQALINGQAAVTEKLLTSPSSIFPAPKMPLWSPTSDTHIEMSHLVSAADAVES